MTNASIPIRFDKSHLTSIGTRLYSQSLDLVRELVANAYDADATNVDIRLNGDNLTVCDNGSGMDRVGLEQYFTIGSLYKKDNPVSPKYGRTRIGEFGIGKFAVLSLCDRFELYTQSPEYAATVIFDKTDFEASAEWNVPLVEHAVKENAKIGTRVTLFALKKPIDPGDLERHLTHVFPLNDKHFSISIDGIKLQPHYIPGRRFKIYEKTQYGTVNGEAVLAGILLSKDQIGIGLRVKNVLIKRDTFGLERRHSGSFNRLTGEVAADFLPITTARNEFITDSEEYQTFYKVMEKKLRRVMREIEKSTLSYADKKAEKTLSDALAMIRHALKKNSDIFLPGEMPLFTTNKGLKKAETNLTDTVIGQALAQKRGKLPQSTSFTEDNIKALITEAVKKLRPQARQPVKTVLRDNRRIIKKIKIGGVELLVSFAHLGESEKESFTEGGIIFINRDHTLFKRIGSKAELSFYHLVRLVTQELVKLASPKDLEVAYNWQGRLIADAMG